MHKIWQIKKQREIETLHRLDAQSPVMRLVGIDETRDELRAVLEFQTQTLVFRSGQAALAGPVLVGLRYLCEFLSAAPHPLEIVTILQPTGIFHPNAAPNGSICLGHVPAGFTCESALHLVWAGLNLNMSAVNLQRGEIINPAAAEFVRARFYDFPISAKGLLEEPDPRSTRKALATPASHEA